MDISDDSDEQVSILKSLLYRAIYRVINYIE